MTTYYKNILKGLQNCKPTRGFESSSVTIQYQKKLVCDTALYAR